MAKLEPSLPGDKHNAGYDEHGKARQQPDKEHKTGAGVNREINEGSDLEARWNGHAGPDGVLAAASEGAPEVDGKAEPPGTRQTQEAEPLGMLEKQGAELN